MEYVLANRVMILGLLIYIMLNGFLFLDVFWNVGIIFRIKLIKLSAAIGNLSLRICTKNTVTNQKCNVVFVKTKDLEGSHN